jgi:uncharacterized protein involved in exopolysaccharide biosynthesis
MLPIFLIISALSVFVAMQMPTSYEARSRLLVALGDEYVYRPAVGSEAAGVAPESEELIQAELELIRSPVVVERTLSALSVERIFPELAETCAKNLKTLPGTEVNGRLVTRESLEYECFQNAVTAMQRKFGAGAAPKTPVLLATYEHDDPQLSAEVLNRLIGSYLQYRTEVFTDTSAGSFGEQRARFEGDLSESDEAIRDFLEDNDIGDFASERDTVRQLYQTASAELLANRSRARVVDGQLSVYQRQLQNVEPEQDLFVEDTSSQRLLDLKLEREDKLTRYKPESRVIKEIDKRIAQAEAYLANQSGPTGTVRRGPNPVFQEIETAANNLEAEAQSLRQQNVELERQLASIEGRQRQLSNLEPRYQELQRQRDLLEQNVRSFSEREVEARTRTEMIQQNVKNIRVLERATPPVEGSSLKFPVAVLGILFAAFTALMAGLLRVMTREGFSTGRSIERTLGIPVLANVKKR